MKYSSSLIINAPLDKVVALWLDDSNLGEWQDHFQSKELIEGVKGTVGAKSLIKLGGSRPMQLTETIKSVNLPSEQSSLYEHEHMDNIHTTRFVAISNAQTKYTMEGEYIKFHSFMPRMMALLFPGMFRKMSQKWANQFKAFVEKTVSS